MNPPPHRILVIGCGSIGERHVRTFLRTGRAGIMACDPQAEVRRRMTDRYGVNALPEWEPALAEPGVTGVVVATPAPLHVPMAARALEFRRHVLIEKPLAVEREGAEGLIAAARRSNVFAGVAYVHHFQPALQAARRFLHAGEFGPVRHAAVVAGHDFPAARPAYREIYYRDHAQGGGAIQDALTHLANCIEWVLGPTERVFCDAGHQVLEGVDVEDTVAVTARNSSAIVSYALNQFQAPTETRLDFHAPGGSVRVEFHAQRWGTHARGAGGWTWHEAPVAERDTLFVAQAHAFLDACEGRPHPTCSLEEGLQTLRFNLAALQSWRSGRPATP